MEEDTGLSHLRGGVFESYGFGHFGHAEPQAWRAAALGHPPPTPDLPLARVHDTTLGQRGTIRVAPTSVAFSTTVHPSTLRHRLIE